MSDTTTGTTSPLSMEDAKTLKFIAELQGQIEQEREHADRLAEALKHLVRRLSTCHSCHAELLAPECTIHCEDCPSGCEHHDAPDCESLERLLREAKSIGAEHAKLRGAK